MEDIREAGRHHGFSGGGWGWSPEPSSWNLPICTKLSSVVILGLVQTTCERNFLDNFVRSRRVFGGISHPGAGFV